MATYCGKFARQPKKPRVFRLKLMFMNFIVQQSGDKWPLAARAR
jgi:hypothetical protein